MSPIISTPRAAGRTVVALTAVALLSACASHPKTAPIAPAPPPPAAPPPATTSAAPPPAPVTATPLPGSVQDFVVNVGDRVYFDFDKSDLRSDSIPLLEAQATWLSRYPQVQVRIEGNCDERGTREYNFALGARRAANVRDFLMQHGVNGDRIATISYGKERPIDLGAGETAWAHNRNAHTAITSGALPG